MASVRAGVSKRWQTMLHKCKQDSKDLCRTNEGEDEGWYEGLPSSLTATFFTFTV